MNLNYVQEGAGPAVILVHAFPLNNAMWAPQVAALKNRFRVIAPDLRGFGKSSVSDSWNLEDAADDLAGLLDSLEVRDCALVGLSMGGYVALPFYSKYSSRVRQLVLADTRARADNDTEKAARTNMIADLEHSGAAILPERMLPRLLKGNSPPEVVKTVRHIIETTSTNAAILALMAMRDRPDASTVLHRISCPALVIAGEHDAVTRIEECKEMAETIDGAKFVNVADAGHLSNLENPDEFNRALSEFLSL
jgi:pimeloyl-ACP methyl ester carboxylesterase